MSSEKKYLKTTKKRAQAIKKRYVSTTASQSRFGPLFNTEISWDGLHYCDCSEGFSVMDVEMLIELACELELDRCEGFDGDYPYNCAPVHAINALLLLVSSNRSLLADTVAQRLAPRCAETVAVVDSDFVIKVLGHNIVMLLCECGPPAIPYLVTEMRRLILTPDLSSASWLGASYVGEAIRYIIRECYTDIPLAILLTDQFCAPLLEFGRHPTTTHNPVNKENASGFLGNLLQLAILITDEKEVLELCRNEHCDEYRWIDVLRLFSLEPHPQDELLRVRGNRMDWVIQTWNKNHPDRQYPFPRGVTDGPFPGQPGYELPKRLFRHKYCTGSSECSIGSTAISNAQGNIKVCERCEHTYYCSEECQRKDWEGCNGDGNQEKLKSYPPKFRVKPLKRLTKYHQTASHRPHCLLIQAYKQWVKIQKHVQRNAVVA